MPHLEYIQLTSSWGWNCWWFRKIWQEIWLTNYIVYRYLTTGSDTSWVVQDFLHQQNHQRFSSPIGCCIVVGGISGNGAKSSLSQSKNWYPQELTWPLKIGLPNMNGFSEQNVSFWEGISPKHGFADWCEGTLSLMAVANLPQIGSPDVVIPKWSLPKLWIIEMTNAKKLDPPKFAGWVL